MGPLEQVISRGFNRPSRAILLDLVNTFNHISLGQDEVEFGDPEELDQRPDVLVDADTFIPAKIAETAYGNFPGEDGFVYGRIDIGKLIGSATPLINPTGDVYTTHEVIDQINYQFSSQLTVKDLLNDTYRRADEQIILRVSPQSEVWKGGLTATASNVYKVVHVRVTEDDEIRITVDDQIRQV